MSGAVPVPRLQLGTVDRETVMAIGRSSTQNTPRRGGDFRSPRPTRAPSSSAAHAAHSGQPSRAGSPGRMPTARTVDSRGASAAAGDLLNLDFHETGYDQTSSKMMTQLYQEREEKRRLLHLMRTSTGPDPHAVEAWTKAAASPRPHDGSVRGAQTERYARGRVPEHAQGASQGARFSLSPDARARSQTDRLQERAAVPQTPEDRKSNTYGFMLPFDVSLPSFASVSSVFQSMPEGPGSVKPAPQSWMHRFDGRSPMQKAGQVTSRRGLDFDAAPEQATGAPQEGHKPALARHLPDNRKGMPADAANGDMTSQKQPGSDSQLAAERQRNQDLVEQLQDEYRKAEEQDEQLQRLRREREFLVRKCAALTVGVQHGAPAVEAAPGAAPEDFGVAAAQVADLQERLEAAVARAEALEGEVLQVRQERDEAVRALEGARKERDEAVARQVQQQKMLLERAGDTQTAFQAPAKAANRPQEADVAAIKSLKDDVAAANAALSDSKRVQAAQSAELASARRALEALHAAVCGGEGTAAKSQALVGIGNKASQVTRQDKGAGSAVGAHVAVEDLQKQGVRAFAELQAQMEELRRQLAEAGSASENAANKVSLEAASLRARLEEQGKVEEAAQRQLQDLVKACREADQKAADATAQLNVMRAKEEETRLAKEALEARLAACDATAAAAEERAKALATQLQQSKAAEAEQMMMIEEARTAVTLLFSAIRKQSAQGPVGGVGISLALSDVSVKGRKTKVIKIDGIAADGAAKASGLVEVGDVLLQVDGGLARPHHDATRHRASARDYPGAQRRVLHQRGCRQHPQYDCRGRGT